MPATWRTCDMAAVELGMMDSELEKGGRECARWEGTQRSTGMPVGCKVYQLFYPHVFAVCKSGS